MSELEKVGLENLAGGEAAELFAAEWSKVLENILDPNTDPKKPREVVLRVKVKPWEGDRQVLDTTVECTSKLVHGKPAIRRLHVGRERGEAVAVDVVQYSAFPKTEAADAAVTPITSAQAK